MNLCCGFGSRIFLMPSWLALWQALESSCLWVTSADDCSIESSCWLSWILIWLGCWVDICWVVGSGGR